MLATLVSRVGLVLQYRKDRLTSPLISYKKIGFSRVFEVFDEFHLMSPKSLKCLQVSKFAKLMEEFKDSFVDFN